jgi:hypothetical protein
MGKGRRLRLEDPDSHRSLGVLWDLSSMFLSKYGVL